MPTKWIYVFAVNISPGPTKDRKFYRGRVPTVTESIVRSRLAPPPVTGFKTLISKVLVRIYNVLYHKKPHIIFSMTGVESVLGK